MVACGVRHEEQVGVLLLRPLRVRRERTVPGTRMLLTVAAPAEIGTNGRDVALAERRVLREDDDLLADALAEDLLDRERVLDRLATGAERVAVVARDEIRRAGPEMFRTRFCSASGAIWSAMPDWCYRR